MRKIAREYENPIDNVNIDLCDALCPLFKKMGFTPNGITTLSMILGLLAVFILWRKDKHRKLTTKEIVVFSICYYLSYLFDCMDGHYARKYGMVSKGGDIYDHVKDVTVNLLLIIVVLVKYPVRRIVRIQVVLLLLVGSVMMVAHLGCQEKIYPEKESDTLSFAKEMCVGEPTQTIKMTRYFGCGTWCIMIIVAIIYLNAHLKT